MIIPLAPPFPPPLDPIEEAPTALRAARAIHSALPRQHAGRLSPALRSALWLLVLASASFAAAALGARLARR